jgi:hypothetical protein
MEGIVYETGDRKLAGKKRYLVYYHEPYNGHWVNVYDDNYRTRFFAWMQAKVWESLGHRARIVDTKRKSNDTT